VVVSQSQPFSCSFRHWRFLDHSTFPQNANICCAIQIPEHLHFIRTIISVSSLVSLPKQPPPVTATSADSESSLLHSFHDDEWAYRFGGFAKILWDQPESWYHSDGNFDYVQPDGPAFILNDQIPHSAQPDYGTWAVSNTIAHTVQFEPTEKKPELSFAPLVFEQQILARHQTATLGEL
jgi:hypothetical protein